jgi:hypothetical protein
MISVLLVSACRLMAAGLVAYLLLYLSDGMAPADASHVGGADAFSIDMNPFGPTTNTATTLGSQQTCAGIESTASRTPMRWYRHCDG